MKIPDEKLKLKMMRQLLLVRGFEEKVNEMFQMGRINGTTHLGIGQEACAVGSINALKKDDYIISNHRGHGHCLVKGANLVKMMAELFGKEEGFCHGMGGSMHIVDVTTRNLGANGIVGGGFSISVGVALTLKKREMPHIIANFFGDGSTNEGSFHESLNLASLWKLPLLFICENNLYGMSTPFAKASAVESVAVRGQAYNIPASTIDGNDLLAVFQAVSEASEEVRKGEGPRLIEMLTYRWNGHSKSDPRAYRTKGEEQQWKEKCPIKRYHNLLLAEGSLNEGDYEILVKEVNQEIEEGIKYVEGLPYPSIEFMKQLVYA